MSATPGPVVITMGEPQSVLTGDNGTTYNSRLYKKSGNSYDLATFLVVS